MGGRGRLILPARVQHLCLESEVLPLLGREKQATPPQWSLSVSPVLSGGVGWGVLDLLVHRVSCALAPAVSLTPE